MLNKTKPFFEPFINSYRNGSHPCMIVSAQRNSGKTTRLRQLIKLLQSEFNLTGIITESSQHKESYSARNITSGKVRVLMEESGEQNPGDFIHNRFIVHQNQFNLCTKTIITSYSGQLIIIDEVGKIELEEKGWFRLLCFARRKPLIITVREPFVNDVKVKFLSERDCIFIEKL